RCASGPTPVAIVVQTIGDRIGTKLVIRVEYPSAASLFQLGIRPSAARRSRISKSRPSNPIQRTGAIPPAGRFALAETSALSTGGVWTTCAGAEPADSAAAGSRPLRPQAASAGSASQRARRDADLRRLTEFASVCAGAE